MGDLFGLAQGLEVKWRSVIVWLFLSRARQFERSTSWDPDWTRPSAGLLHELRRCHRRAWRFSCWALGLSTRCVLSPEFAVNGDAFPTRHIP